MPKTLAVTIEHGKLQVEASGFVGTECVKATEELEKLLAGKVEREKKPEFYARNGVAQAARAGGGR